MSLDALKDQLDGITGDVFQADRAYALHCLIAQKAAAINGAGFGTFFGAVQGILIQDYILGITKAFAPVSKHNPIRSIPATIALLERSLDEFKIPNKHCVLSKLRRAGVAVAPLKDSTDRDITRAVVEHYNGNMPSQAMTVGLESFRTLDALKARRDKVIAHNESIDPENFPGMDWDATQNLLELAKSFADVVGAGYLGLMYASDTGEYFLSDDAQKASLCLERLLDEAKI